MLTFLIRRATWGVVVMLAIASTAFLLTFVAPTDPARSIAGPNASARAVAAIRVALGLDRPVLDQFGSWLGGVVQGDLGRSYQLGGIAVTDVILGRLPATAELALAGLALGVLMGVPLGVMAARSRGGLLDRSASVLGSVFVAVPAFLVGLLLIHWLAYRPLVDLGIELFPLPGSEWHPLDLRALALPAITLAIATAPFYIRLTRGMMLDELHHDHIRTARAKGLSERTVAWRHAFRNALPPIVAQTGLDLGFLLGGVVVVEVIFSWPGIGDQAVKSITSEDLPMLMGTLLLGTFFIVVANIAVDVVNAVLDPRVAHWNDDRR